jgi:hypothetical protein
MKIKKHPSSMQTLNYINAPATLCSQKSSWNKTIKWTNVQNPCMYSHQITQSHARSWGPHIISQYLHNFCICKDVCWWNQVPIHLLRQCCMSSWTTNANNPWLCSNSYQKSGVYWTDERNWLLIHSYLSCHHLISHICVYLVCIVNDCCPLWQILHLQ